MNIRHRITARFVLAIFVCSLAALAWSQEPPDKAAKANKPAAENAADKATVEKAKVAPPPSAEVTAVLETKPSTPSECVRAAKVLVDLNRPDLAKDLLKKVLDAKLDQQQLAELRSQIDQGIFLDLPTHAELLPEARQVVDAVMAAVNAKLQDPERIAGLIRQLTDPSEARLAAALAGLLEAGEGAIGPLVQVLADPARSAEQPNVRTVLAQMGRQARDPLMGILDRANPKLAVQIILTLAEMRDPNAELCLLAPCWLGDANVRAAAAASLKQLTGRAANRAEAGRRLTDAAKLYFQRRQAVEGAIDGKVTLWQWDEEKHACDTKSCLAEDAARAMAARWARDAYRLAPNSRNALQFHMTAMLDAAAYEKGLDQPLDDDDPAMVEAKKLGVKAIDDCLAFAMDHERPAAATAAARLLGQIGKVDEVLHQGAEPAPLARALRQPDRRLRMAALEAVVHLRPTRPFSGSSYVPAALQFFAAEGGIRRALAAGPNQEETRHVAGMLTTAGFQADTAVIGRELLLMAARSPDYELAMLDMTITNPEIAMLVQELRHDERTASLRVGLIAKPGHLDQAERIARQDPLAMAFSRPHDEQTLRWQVAQLDTLAPREFVGFDVRQQQAAKALDLWAELGESSSKLYDLRRVQDAVLAALRNPKLSMKAVAVLANVNSTESQQALVELASRFTQPVELRMASAEALRHNIQRHGILLTIDEIRAQYRRYNESEALDTATQRVLGLILDSLEAPTQAARPKG
jgi:hypothetical protein